MVGDVVVVVVGPLTQYAKPTSIFVPVETRQQIIIIMLNIVVVH